MTRGRSLVWQHVRHAIIALFPAIAAGTFVSVIAVDMARCEAEARQALDATTGPAVVAANPAYSSCPITFECWVKFDSKLSYNIIVANEDKPSSTHWELFTMPGTGHLSAYIPGRKPDHVHTGLAVVDGQWHYLAFVLEADRARICVDGVERARESLVGPTGKSLPGSLVFGALVTYELRCKGQIAEARLSKGARRIDGLPGAELAVDEDTLGLWRFDKQEGGKFPDLSPLRNAAEIKKMPPELGPGHLAVAGGMSAGYQPLPPPEEVAPLRKALMETAARLHLSTVAVDQLRDGVLREWSYDYQWIGKLEYPEARGVWWLDKEALKQQVFDRHSLVWESDGGPLGTVLRRTGALIANLKRAGHLSKIAATVRDFEALKSACETSKPATDSDLYRGCYLAACALRRQIALSNPLLDFDTILFVARGTFAGSARSNPATADVQGGHFATQFFGFNALPGGGLFMVRNFRTDPEIINVLEKSVVQYGRLKGKKLDYGAFATPDLSFDGKTIVFAWTGNTEHKWIWSKKTLWHLFKVNVDGGNLTQLTDGAYDDFDPCWLPNGRIAFISERRGGHIRCFSAYLKVRNYTLFSMKDDGSDLLPLSFYETSEWNPSVNNDGKLIYTRWDYTDRENCLGTRFWMCGPDGTDARSTHGNYPVPYDTFEDHKPWKHFPDGREMDSRIGAPLVEMGLRAIPNSPKYLCTGAPHHGEVFGTLCMLDLGKEDDNHMSQVKRLTPDEPFPETEMPGRRHYKYGTPWPLSEDFYLCNVWENLVLLDRYGNKELLCDLQSLPCKQDERLRLIDPIPVRPRTKPPALPPRTRQGEPLDGDGVGLHRPGLPELNSENRLHRSTTPAQSNPKATLAVMNVYDSDLPFPKGTKIKWLRIVQNILKENHAMGDPMIGYERENTPRIPLGVVPVEKDGSVYCEAPVAKELIFQALDENYMAVQSMRSVAFVHPGEQLTCQGCHEKTRKPPSRNRTPLALKRRPSKILPETGSLEPVSYYRQIKPIFDGKCVTCHKSTGKGPQDMSYEAMRNYTFWFSGAMYLDMTSDYSGIHGGSRTIPGRFGARNSRIGRALMDATHLKAVSPEDRHRIIVWLDCNSLRLGAYVREEAQLKGELVWPTLDVDPENVLGVEGAGRPLKKSFWHENQFGPHAFLCSDHVFDKVFIFDERGEMQWDYSVPHPQDVWMLPNGNILTTYYQGVREVTRDKRIVWEYTTRKPNEIPNCQPLPDGNVLIGIVGECRLIEVNRKGEVLRQVQLSTSVKEPHAQFRMCRKTPEGTYLVPFMAEGAVREYDREGKVLREFPRKSNPVAVLRLEEGNTLISAGGQVTEYDKDDRVMWELSPDDIPDINIGILAGIQRLPNGNTIVCNWNAKDSGDQEGAHLFEVTPDKRVVWQVTGPKLGQVAQCQLLTSDLKARTEGILK